MAVAYDGRREIIDALNRLLGQCTDVGDGTGDWEGLISQNLYRRPARSRSDCAHLR
ncbi:hypothetical protein GCM10027089_32450 [Nocardia thraciensis]